MFSNFLERGGVRIEQAHRKYISKPFLFLQIFSKIKRSYKKIIFKIAGVLGVPIIKKYFSCIFYLSINSQKTKSKLLIQNKFIINFIIKIIFLIADAGVSGGKS